MREIVSKFEVKFGILQAFGCIDGTDVSLKRQLIRTIFMITSSFLHEMFKQFKSVH